MGSDNLTEDWSTKHKYFPHSLTGGERRKKIEEEKSIRDIDVVGAIWHVYIDI